MIIRLLLSQMLLFSIVFSAHAHPTLMATLPKPVPPPGADGEAQLLSLYSCTCEGKSALDLEDTQCACPEAEEDRAALLDDYRTRPARSRATGKAALVSALRLNDIVPRLRRSVQFDSVAYDTLWENTKSVCPAQQMRVFAKTPISCPVRGMWSNRFRTMLAMGYSPDEIVAFYVADSNASSPPKQPWTVQSVVYKKASSGTFLVPLLVGVLLWVLLLGVRRLRNAVSAGGGEAPVALSEAERQLLREELEESLEQ